MSILLKKINIIDVNNRKPISITIHNSNNLLNQKIQNVINQTESLINKVEYLDELNYRISKSKFENIKETNFYTIVNLVKKYRDILTFYNTNLDTYLHSLLSKNNSINQLRYLFTYFAKLLNIIGTYYKSKLIDIEIEGNTLKSKEKLLFENIVKVITEINNTLISKIDYSNFEKNLIKILSIMNKTSSVEEINYLNYLKSEKFKKLELHFNENKQIFNKKYNQLSITIFEKCKNKEPYSDIELLDDIDRYYLSLESIFKQMFDINPNLNLFDLGEKTYHKFTDIINDIQINKNKFLEVYKNRIKIIQINNSFEYTKELFEINLSVCLSKYKHDKQMGKEGEAFEKIQGYVNELDKKKMTLMHGDDNEDLEIKKNKKIIVSKLDKIIKSIEDFNLSKTNNVILLEKSGTKPEQELYLKINEYQQEHDELKKLFHKKTNEVSSAISSNNSKIVKEIEFNMHEIIIKSQELYKSLITLKAKIDNTLNIEEELKKYRHIIDQIIEEYSVWKTMLYKNNEYRLSQQKLNIIYKEILGKIVIDHKKYQEYESIVKIVLNLNYELINLINEFLKLSNRDNTLLTNKLLELYQTKDILIKNLDFIKKYQRKK